MEVVEITENCYSLIISLSGHTYNDYCIYDSNNNVIAFKHFVGNSIKYYGLIENKYN